MIPRVHNRRSFHTSILSFSFAFGLRLTIAAEAQEPPKQGIDWHDDYAIVSGFRIEQDTTGFHFPTAIAFVPEPGSGPKDPLYFVTEIRGKVKVVTNDRTVYTFAEDFFDLEPKLELPRAMGEIGLAGVCLDPENGYIFVSFAYEDEDKIYRNGIVRFESTRKVFSVKPTGQKQLAPVLSQFESSISHQIGPLVVHDGLLYVGVGDGEIVENPRNLETTNGKLLRMTLDGFPAPGNPFAVNGDPMIARNFIWSYGLRNPFSLAIVNDRVFVADNGPAIDRFVEVHSGEDFMYTGSDASVSANALFLWVPAASPVQMDFDRGAAAVAGFPAEWRSQFYIALSGSPTHPPGPRPGDSRSVTALNFDFESGRLRETPRILMRYIGENKQLFVGLGFGPDGLYVIPLLPDNEGNSAVLRITYDPEREHTNTLGGSFRPVSTMISEYGCLSCHTIDGKGFGTVGPPIIREDFATVLAGRLNSPEYEAQLDAIDQLSAPVFQETAEARQTVRDAQGTERLKSWLKFRLLEPRFDQEVIAMPNVGMTEEEASRLADWLLEPGLKATPLAHTFKQGIKESLPEPTHTNMVFTFLIGGVGGLAVALLFSGLLQRRKHQQEL